ncbi:twin-arginine translocase subunit TatC [Amycolatopsis sp. NPDC026612]|uniref:twin-arginine translocase subunit TatC n=1 Tax=Amycolatopsis sp. NPDC026612 TaxID=3155466 RepID=UPI0033F8A739
MALLEHILELRRRMTLALLAVVAGTVVGFLWFQYRVGPIPSLGSLLTEPYCRLDPQLRLNVNGSSECRLLQTQPFEAFLVRIKVGIAAGTVLTSPVWLYHVWAFITPALHRDEQKLTRIFVFCAVTLFVCGAALAYLIVPVALNALLAVGGDQFVAALAGNDYVAFVLALLLVFGVSFELPLFVVMLNRVGVLPYTRLRKWRRGIIFVLFAFAGLVTPGSDPFSMLGLAGALTVLFEFAVQLARVHDRKLAGRRHDQDVLDDADATSLSTQEPTCSG